MRAKFEHNGVGNFRGKIISLAGAGGMVFIRGWGMEPGFLRCFEKSCLRFWWIAGINCLAWESDFD